MVKKALFTFIFLFFALLSYPFDILINQTDYSVELKFSGLSDFVTDVVKKKGRILIVLDRRISFESLKNIEGKLVKNIEGDDNYITVLLKKDVDFYYKKDGKDFFLFITPKRVISDINLKSPIAKPILKTKSRKIKDEGAEKLLAEVEKEVDEGQYDIAITQLRDLILKHENDFYAQEAYYRLGMIYFKMGEDDPKNYLRASDYLSDFASKFPDNYRAPDALYYSALAKEKAGMYFEAIFDYKAIIMTYPETTFAKNSYMRIANIYENIGQFDKAINALLEYSKKFKDNSIVVNAKIGSLYAKLKDFTLAREYFLKVVDSKDDLVKLGDEILFSMAKTFDMKGNYNYAIKIYTKLYNIFPKSKHADIAMYNTALIFEKEKKDNIADSILLECKDKYSTKLGGLKAAIHYTEKYLNKFNTEYWKEFLKDVLSNDIDINLKSVANRLIIESLFREKRFDEALSLIADFENRFFDTPELNRVYQIKQDIYLNLARQYFKRNDFVRAKEYIDKLITEFPESKLRYDAEKISESISLIKAKNLFDSGDYENAFKMVQDFLISHRKIYFKEKWNTLMEESYYQKFLKYKKSDKLENMVALIKEYFVYFPKGKYKDKFLKFLGDYYIGKFVNFITSGMYITTINFYNNNLKWIKQIPDEGVRSALNGYLAYCYYKVGDRDKARELYKKIKGSGISIEKVLGILFGEEVTVETVNALTPKDLEIVFEDLKKDKTDEIYKILQLYRKDIKLKYSLIYKLLDFFDEERRWNEVKKLYDEFKGLNLLDQFPEIYYDRGILAFKEKDYKTAVTLLKKFTELKPESNNIAESYFYIAKSYDELKSDNALKYYELLLKDYPDTIYAKLAKNEIKVKNWLKKVKGTN